MGRRQGEFSPAQRSTGHILITLHRPLPDFGGIGQNASLYRGRSLGRGTVAWREDPGSVLGRDRRQSFRCRGRAVGIGFVPGCRYPLMPTRSGVGRGLARLFSFSGAGPFMLLISAVG